MGDIELVFPTKFHEASVSEYLREHIDFGENSLHGDSYLDEAESYDEWLMNINKALHGEIPSVIFFAVRKIDGKMLGTINVRHPYKGYVQIHGHIGYGVRPSERGKGYATSMLKLALDYCKDIGLEKVLLTCDKSNVASAKTITKCLGVFESESLQPDGRTLQRYWINISNSEVN
ncbi:MAG: GNAT family N-acetyltransferase [Defluviitaleaceae bacterium]|nr:GNAT family N-acetyltransferase [Defluviitaleaceae bacterium]